MSIVMKISERAGLMGQQPPKRIVERGMASAGEPPNPDAVDALAGIAHLVFGTVSGAVFGLVISSQPRIAHRFAMPWALAIWLVSYFGWIPALRLLPPPPQDRPGRAWTMLVAHVVYGATLGALWRQLSRR